MKAILYHRADGGLSVMTPADGARLCRAITVDGQRTAFEPVTFEHLVRACKTDQLAPEWAETEAQFAARIAARDVPEGLSWQVVDDSTLPTDRTFRGAWKAGIGTVVVDMPLAREIQRDRLRELRAPQLADLDVEFMRAVESGDAAAQKDIAARKQALRDVTDDPAIDAAKTPEALLEAMPAALKLEARA